MERRYLVTSLLLTILLSFYLSIKFEMIRSTELITMKSWAVKTFPGLYKLEINSEQQCDDTLIPAMMEKLNETVQSRMAKARKFRTYLNTLSINGFYNASYSTGAKLVTVQPSSGRLGNFMFEWASLLGIALRTNRVPVQVFPDPRLLLFEGMDFENLDISNLTLNGTVRGLDPFVRGECNGPMKVCEKFFSLDEMFNNASLAVVAGFLQSWKYFDHARDDVRAMLTFTELTFRRALYRIENALYHFVYGSSEPCDNIQPVLVGVHVRRGDILESNQAAFGRVPAPESYLLQRVHHIQKTYRYVLFFILTDDVPYCKTVFKEDNFVFAEPSSTPEVDMAVMSLMDICVISVGSYGWWGAYLSDAAEIYYYENWARNGTALHSMLVAEDYFLPSWQGHD